MKFFVRARAGLISCALLPLAAARGAADALPRGVPLVSDPPPSIDGTITRLATVPGWQKWDRREQIVFGGDKWHGPRDLSGETLVAWDRNFLYVAARVTDDRVEQPYFGANLWNGDHVMLLLDLPRQTEGSREAKRVMRIGISPGNLGEGGVPVSPPEAYSFDVKNGPVAGARVAARRTAQGYDIEAALPWKWLGLDQPAAGVPLAYDMIVSDADDPANPKQEKLASLLTSPWHFADPDRMLEAALGDTTGRVNPASLLSTKTTPLGPTLRLAPGQSQNIHGAGRPKVRELVLKARLDFDHLAGGSPGMTVVLNGTLLDMGRIQNRLTSFLFGIDEASSYVNGRGWYLLFAPDFRPPAPFTAYYAPDIAPYDFRFDVAGLWKPGDNVVQMTNTAASAALVVEAGTSEQLSPKFLPPPVEPAPTGAIPTFEPLAPRTKAAFGWALEPGGAIRVTLGPRNREIVSAFSTTDPGWASLGEKVGGGGWKTLAVEKESVAATTRDFRLERTVRAFADHLTVSDTLTNLSADDLPILLRHEMETEPGKPDIYIAGRKIESPQFYTNEGEVPTSLAVDAAGALGLVMEDDVLRAQGQNFVSDGKIGLEDSNLILAKGRAITTEFSIYPLEKPDPFLFLNRVRETWNVNFKVEGGGLFLPSTNLPPFAGMPDAGLGQYIQDKAGHFMILGGLSGTQGSVLEKIDLKPIEDFCARLKRAAPGSKLMPYYHSFLSENLDDVSRFAKDRLLTSNGTQADYGSPNDPLFVPREGSEFAREEEGLIKLRFDQLGGDGIYWDELEYSADKWDYNPLYWDGVSGEINPETHRLIRKASNIMLATQPWRLRMMSQIMARGPLVGNGAPETRSVMNVHFPRFIETGSITNLTKGQLYTPIALGDHLTERTEIDAYKDMVKALDYGCVYYWYHPQVPVSHTTLSSFMFPITPMRLGPGYIIGRERIITNRSGYFGWGDGSSFQAIVFDAKGHRTNELKIPSVTQQGRTLAEVRIPGGWSVALLRSGAK